MPNIPTITSPEVVNNPTISPEMAGSGYGAVAKMGEAFESMAEYSSNVFGMIQRAQTHLALMNAETAIQGDVLDHAEAFKQRGDYKPASGEQFTPETVYNGDMNKAADELYKKYQGQYGKDPAVWGAVEPHLKSQINGLKKAVFRDALSKSVEDTKMNLNMMEESYSHDWAMSQTSEMKKIAENGFKLHLSEAVNNGVITEGDANVRFGRFMEKREENEIKTGLRSNDPNVVQATVNKMSNPDNYPHVKNIDSLQTQGENRLEVVSARQEKQQDKAATDLAVDYLDRKYTIEGKTDFAALHKDLDNPDFRKEHGLDTKRTEQVRTFFDGRQGEQDKTQSREQKKYANDMADAFTKGDLSKVHQMVLGAGDNLTAEQKKSWTEAIEHEARESRTEARYAHTLSNEERTMKRQEAQDKSDAIYGEIAAKISDGKLYDPTTEIYGRLKDGLKGQQANLLHNMWKQDVDPNFKLGMDVVNDAFNSKAIDAPGRGKAVLDLHEAVKKDNLKGKAIIDKANEIVHPKVQGWVGKTIDSILGKGKPESSSKEQYEVGKMYSDAKGRKAKYIGEGKWQIQP